MTDAAPLVALLDRLRAAHAPIPPVSAPPCPESEDPLVHELVYSFLAADWSLPAAADGLARLMADLADYNELRVCMPDEIAGVLGDQCPGAPDRSARLRAALNDTYRVEHAMTLARVRDLSKREARQFIVALDGMTPFVAGRLLLLRLEAHAVPADDRIAGLLADEGLIAPGAGADEASQWLERHTKAGAAAEVYALLEAGAAARPRRSRSKGGSARGDAAAKKPRARKGA